MIKTITTICNEKAEEYKVKITQKEVKNFINFSGIIYPDKQLNDTFIEILKNELYNLDWKYNRKIIDCIDMTINKYKDYCYDLEIDGYENPLHS